MVYRFLDKELGVWVVVCSRRNVMRTSVRVRDGVVRLSVPDRAGRVYAGGVLPREVADVVRELLEREKVLSERRGRFEVGMVVETARGRIVVRGNERLCVGALRHGYDADGVVLWLEVNEGTDISGGGFQKAMRKAVGERLREMAEAGLRQRVMEWAKRYGFEISGLSFRVASSRWGSCSSRGKVMLSGYLWLLSDDVVEYVVVHELCHLRYMNHGAEFKRLLHGFFPDHERREAELREAGEKFGWLMRR